MNNNTNKEKKIIYFTNKEFSFTSGRVLEILEKEGFDFKINNELKTDKKYLPRIEEAKKEAILQEQQDKEEFRKEIQSIVYFEDFAKRYMDKTNFSKNVNNWLGVILQEESQKK